MLKSPAPSKVRRVFAEGARSAEPPISHGTFFATAFKKTVDKLGIVYTPVEIVDFILNSAEHVLRSEFAKGLTDEGVHILDGFTGTGTFIIRLLQSGLIEPHDLARKYAEEMHANEILLLAYYIAAVNIETVYHDLARKRDPGAKYRSFPGLILTDTFQSWEDDDRPDLHVFPENNQRLERLKRLPITVIIGNPPYSSRQDSANDNNANETYPSLDAAIRKTYAELSSATNKNSLYDSYIRAIKWATLRIRDCGVIAYVTNGGWLDSNTADGMRKTLTEEFSSIYIFNLRGNRRNAGAEGRPIFEATHKAEGGSITSIAIIVLVKNPSNGRDAVVRYAQVEDFLTAREKIDVVTAARSVAGLQFETITPNGYGDWLNQRRDDFQVFLPLGSKRPGPAVIGQYSKGLNTARSVWAYAFSTDALRAKMQQLIAKYESDRIRLLRDQRAKLTEDEHHIKWSRTLERSARRGTPLMFDEEAVRLSMFRPFNAQRVYLDRHLNDQMYSLPKMFPSSATQNFGIVLTDISSHHPFSFLMIDKIPDLHTLDTGQFFPRWRYEPIEDEGVIFSVESDGNVAHGYRRIDNVTDEALRRFTAAFGSDISKDDIFYYIYGLLHSPKYRETYAADLKKMLPRIPLVENPWPFVEAGRGLSELHLGYESEIPFPLDGLSIEPVGDPYEFFRVQKMTIAKARKEGKLASIRSTIVYNSRIALSGIPEEAYRYMLGSRSAIEWVIDRYQVKTDPASGIVSDPNDWSREARNPRYIIDLLARVVTVSIETMQIVDALPELAIREVQNP